MPFLTILQGILKATLGCTQKKSSQKCSQFQEEDGLVARFLYQSFRLAGCGNALLWPHWSLTCWQKIYEINHEVCPQKLDKRCKEPAAAKLTCLVGSAFDPLCIQLSVINVFQAIPLKESTLIFIQLAVTKIPMLPMYISALKWPYLIHTYITIAIVEPIQQ